MKKRLILGDIHGHFDFVKEIYDIEQPDMVICLGDYVDSFHIEPKDIQISLISLFNLQAQHNKKSKTKTFRLLLGNHDFHYLVYDERYSGYRNETEKLSGPLLHDAIDAGDIEMAYVDEVNKTIYTHAGVSQTWFDRWLQGSLGNIHTVTFDAFKFTYGNRFDSTGDNKYSSPIWIRPFSLGCDMWTDKDGVQWKQVVGHTCSKEIIDFINKEKFMSGNEHPNFIMCDSLPWEYMVEYLDDNGVLDHYEIKKFKTFDEEYRQ